ncbi:hypothetical protein LCGC14_1374460 [marine sediment metagenome]|uniref:tRNA uridine 5-carboxymethylaminomethyl modification enzyme C-terminal subdomain domain-containing protein n=1 Tax=marine sediment metagenome TaxID=412755 RepID=A0A0F9KQH4_9ZZZZ
MVNGKNKKQTYDVIVVGGGHAGCEAASAAARMGAQTLMVTTSLDTIGLLACSPSFGGPGRGHLLREIDSLGALMPFVIDRTAIHFRHSGKDSPKWAPFAICDRLHYHRLLKNEIENIKNLTITQDTVADISKNKKSWNLLSVAGQRFTAKTLVIAAGTFLKGRTKQNNASQKAGRNNEVSADALAKSLKGLGLKLGAFRTGTSPTAIIPETGFKEFDKQFFEKKPRHCSFVKPEKEPEQTETFKTFTGSKLLILLKDQQADKERGPRYCPSLIDKLQRFPEKKRHPVFIQPEGLDRREWFLNGLSMDLDNEIQQQIVGLVAGLEGAKIVRYGYSVSYYFLRESQLFETMECRENEGLFFAGQVTGSNGYEEAAATGIMAGINAALKACNKEAVQISSETSYMGVLARDLATKKLAEPYRMLLSRATNAHELRCDNADIRMMGVSGRLKLIDRKRLAQVKAKKVRIEEAVTGKTVSGLTPEDKREIATIRKIENYGLKSTNVKKLNEMAIPRTLDYSKIDVSKEAREKLNRFRPVTIEEAIRLNIPENTVKALALYLQRKAGQRENVSRETKK